jgi:hypothetical protein
VATAVVLANAVFDAIGKHRRRFRSIRSMLKHSSEI